MLIVTGYFGPGILLGGTVSVIRLVGALVVEINEGHPTASDHAV
jgi:hypothetical protein